MIEINILKDRLFRYKQKRVVLNLFLIYVGGLLLILFILSISFWGNIQQIGSIQESIQNIERQKESHKAIIHLIETKGQQTESLLERLAFFMSEYEKRVLWTELLGFISNSLPNGLWLEQLALKPSQDAKSPRVITITGYTLADGVDERASIEMLVRNLSRGKPFETVSLNSVHRETKEQQEVVSFEITCELKQGSKQIVGTSD